LERGVDFLAEGTGIHDAGEQAAAGSSVNFESAGSVRNLARGEFQRQAGGFREVFLVIANHLGALQCCGRRAGQGNDAPRGELSAFIESIL
jgi:hypothetical protein